MRVLGIDEAGRGAVLGPLVIAGVLIEDGMENKLREIGVKDSKQLSRKKRDYLENKIDEIVKHVVVISIPACKIDDYRRSGVNLNELEAQKMAEITNILNPDKLIVDSPSYNSNKFRDYLFSMLDNKKIDIVAENYADVKYPVVSAAGIMAKVERDRRVDDLKNNFFKFDFGTGYSHDERSIALIEKLARENNGKMPMHVRTTWSTVEKITAKYRQKSMLGFLKKRFLEK